MSNPYDLEKFFSLGPWAVIDGFYNIIWINVEKQNVANLIGSVFRTKLNAVVVDISQAKNYHPTLVDSTVSLQWMLEIDDKLFVETLPYPRSSDHAFFELGYSARDRILINEVPDTSLSNAQKKEIQSQIFSFLSVIQYLWGYVLHENAKPEKPELFREICYCYEVEKTLLEIESRLFQTALDHMKSCPKECLLLLGQLNKLYE